MLVQKQLVFLQTCFYTPISNLLTRKTGALGRATFELYDITGRTVLNQQQVNSTTQVDLSALTKGMYLFRIVSKGLLLK